MQPAVDWTRDWDPLVARVGQDIDGPAVRFGPDRVEAGAIRRHAEVLELDCVLHHDEEAARAHGWPGIVAPYSSVWSYTFGPTWEPGDRPTFADEGRDAVPRRSTMSAETFPLAPPTTHMFATNASYEFVRPLIAGERVGISGRHLLRCVPKTTSVGRGAFVTVARSIVTEKFETVARVELDIYLYNPHAAPSGRGATADQVPAAAAQAPEADDGLLDLAFPVPVYRLIMAAGVTRDFTPLHHNDEFARRSGAPAMYASAILLLGMWERLLRDFIGPGGTILAIRDLRMVRFVAAGSVVHVQGRVIGSEARDGRSVLTIELRSTVDGVLAVGPGRAEVTRAGNA